MRKLDEAVYAKRVDNLREYKEKLQNRINRGHRCAAVEGRSLCGDCWMIGFYTDHIHELERRIADMEAQGRV